MKAIIQKKFREKVKSLTDPKAKDAKVKFNIDKDKKKTVAKDDKSDSKKPDDKKPAESKGGDLSAKIDQLTSKVDSLSSQLSSGKDDAAKTSKDDSKKAPSKKSGDDSAKPAANSDNADEKEESKAPKEKAAPAKGKVSAKPDDGSDVDQQSDTDSGKPVGKTEKPAAEDDPDAKKAKRLGPPAKIEDPKGTKVKIDFDPILESDIAFILDGEFEDILEHEDVILDLCEELSQIDEVLTMAGRYRKRAALRRNRTRIRIGRQRAMRRRATTARIGQRARRSAISTMKRRFAGGRAVNKLSFADRARVERIVSKRPRAVANLARRNVRVKRQLEIRRFAHRRTLRNQLENNKPLTEWVDDGSSGGVGSPYQSGNAIANNVNYNAELSKVCDELKVSPLELTKMAQTLGKYAHELSVSQARAVVAEYRKKYDK